MLYPAGKLSQPPDHLQPRRHRPNKSGGPWQTNQKQNQTHGGTQPPNKHPITTGQLTFGQSIRKVFQFNSCKSLIEGDQV